VELRLNYGNTISAAIGHTGGEKHDIITSAKEVIWSLLFVCLYVIPWAGLLKK